MFWCKVPLQALIDALEPAAEARRKILSAFSTQALGGHRNALASHAPMVETLPIDASKRGLVIGKGGETIRRLEVRRPNFANFVVACGHFVVGQVFEQGSRA